MITITCDMCGEKLNPINNQVELCIQYDGIQVLGDTFFRSKQKQLCVACATRLVNWIENQEKVNDTKEI